MPQGIFEIYEPFFKVFPSCRVFCVPHSKYESKIKVSKVHKEWKKIFYRNLYLFQLWYYGIAIRE